MGVPPGAAMAPPAAGPREAGLANGGAWGDLGHVPGDAREAASADTAARGCSSPVAAATREAASRWVSRTQKAAQTAHSGARRHGRQGCPARAVAAEDATAAPRGVAVEANCCVAAFSFHQECSTSEATTLTPVFFKGAQRRGVDVCVLGLASSRASCEGDLGRFRPPARPLARPPALSTPIMKIAERLRLLAPP